MAEKEQFIGTIKPIEIETEMRNAYLDYAMSVITARALPDVRDGMKPVQRRILYTMGEMGLRHNVAFKKCARIVGDVMGRYHPHGDQAVYDALVRMAQDFTMRYTLVDGQGNFGCFTGDTKIKLLDGTEKSFGELAELDPREIFYVYSVDKDGRIAVGEGRNARVTRRNARLIELTLDNGETLRGTPDHKFMLRNGAYKAAQDLTPDDSLMPGYFDAAPVKEGLNDYLRIFQPATGEYEFVHHLADRFNEQKGLARRFKGAFVRHHKNLDRWDNRPTNIERMTFLEHLHLHAEQIAALWEDDSFRDAQRQGVKQYYSEHPKVLEERRQRFIRQNRDEKFREENGQRIAPALKQYFADPDVRAEISSRMKALWQDPDYRAKMSEALRGIDKRALTLAEKARVAKIISQKSRAMWGDEAKRAEIVEAISRAMASEELRAQLRANSKRLWQDPDYRAKYGEGHFSRMAQAFWSNPDAREFHRKKIEQQWMDEDFRIAQKQGVQESNARRMAENPQMMVELANRAKAVLIGKWAEPAYERQIMRQKIAGYVSQLIHQFGRENVTPAVYEAHRDANWIPRIEKALKYFENFDELLYAAEKYNHRIISKRWLDERADVYDITVDKHHNFLLASGVFVHNSIDDDPPAAMRYTEARLTEIAEELLLDIDRDTVDFGENFDGTLTEPRVLPAKAPNLLLNGTAGIAVGMATNIPPHNLGEIVDAIKYLIERWDKLDDIEVDDLMQFVQGPDFPTAGIILGAEGIKQAYATGNGRIVVRGKIHTEEAGGGKARIVITELPFQVNKAALIERIADLVRDRKIEDIGDLRDESDRQGMSVIVELKRGADPKPVINQLLKYTPLQSGFSINTLALVDGEPKVLSLKKMLQLYVQHRQDVITRRTKFDLEKAQARAHILEGLKIALDHLDEVIRTIRQSPDADVAKERLIKRFKLDDIQAQAILDMQLRRLAALERKKIEEELAEVKKTIKYLEDLLRHPKKILGVISDELGDLKKRFGDARRTHISTNGGEEQATEFKEEDLVQAQEVLVSVTQRGYISRMPLSSVRRTATGSKSVQTREEDAVQYLFPANTRDTLLFFTNRGKVYPLRAHQVPDVERQPKGLPLNNFLSFEQSERVTSAVAVSDFTQAEFLTMATLLGRVKRTPLAEFDGIRASGVAAINLGEGDELGWARLTHGDGELMFVTEQGQAMRCQEEDVPVQGRVAGGVYGIKLNEGDKVASMDMVQPDGFLLVVTAKGFGKRTPIKEYSVQNRYTKGVSTLGRDPARGGVIAAARVVNEDDDVTIISTNGVVLRARVANLPKSKRTSRESEVMKLKEGDAVASIARLESEKAKAKSEK